MSAVPPKENCLPRAALALTSTLLLAVLLVPYAAIDALQVKVPAIGGTFAALDSLAPTLDLEHLVAFALVGALARFAQARPRTFRTLLVLTLFGVVTELAQLWVPTRSATVDDLLLNLAGSVVGYAAAALIGGRPHPNPLPEGEGERPKSGGAAEVQERQ